MAPSSERSMVYERVSSVAEVEAELVTIVECCERLSSFGRTTVDGRMMNVQKQFRMLDDDAYKPSWWTS